MSALSAVESLLKDDPSQVIMIMSSRSVTVIDLKQSALEIENLLDRIREELQSNKKLGSLVKYKIVDKGHNQQARLNKLLHFKGPEEATLELLQQKNKEWLDDPSTFWTYGMSPTTGGSHKQGAQIISLYLQAKCIDQ
ncbi:hypothetical protein LTR84_011999 [Exophiala bonariae]|uniref:Uncharacterized protein n=1 Tax=Exophiala bonariae TaxID=1690606 RepID=A0AAV9MRP5_9EURO|nr:hypothetical protein LTR84_011999 [Exophiala bonariae]